MSNDRYSAEKMETKSVKDKASYFFEKALREGRSNLMESEAETVCLEYGIPTAKYRVAITSDEAVQYAAEIGYPVVMKILSPQIIHKTEANGVLINISGPDQTKDAFGKLMHNARKYNASAEILGVLIQKMAPPGTEVIVGALMDPQFGQTVMFGFGGTLAEVYKDVTFRIAPVEAQDAQEMLREIKAYPILGGYRGRAPVDEHALVEIIVNVSKLVMDCPQIAQLDLNPVIAYERGASVVDARIILTAVKGRDEPANASNLMI